MNFKEELKIRTEIVEDIVHKYLPEKEGLQKTVIEASDYAVEVGGKRLRPLIMLETYRLFDGRGKVVEPFMAALEMIHSFSLVHDDLPCMDNDEYRRGKKSTWAMFGEDMGVLAGDALSVYAFEVASKAFDLSSSLRNVGDAISVLANKTGIYGMIGGQSLDVELTGKPISEEQLDFIYRLKTGALLECAMMIGAILADASKEAIATCEKIAAKVGYAFQIEDDILDITSTTEVLGKPVHSDEKNEKTTYVSLHGIEASRAEVKRLSEEAIDLLHGLNGNSEFLECLFRSLIEREK